ncbi:SMAD/FHA domain-containing protein, partial [Zychaea mexicana]|uniref:SMAD/FHA domain-containing protein n=1 Tax=Zychaea mexicana TaxID=64656 RepID=UPI0022FEDA5E
ASSEPCDDDEICVRLVPHVTYNSQCFVFDVIERSLQQGAVLKFGRYNNSWQHDLNRLSFKSKVVSRSHAELWSEDGKVFIRDTGSSSGTFVNRMRLSSVKEDDDSIREVCDGDIIQLGVNYQQGVEPVFRAVRMRLQVSHLRHTTNNNNNNSSNGSPNKPTQQQQPKNRGDMQECCICLYAIAPSQALFVAPCTHVCHFKCLRPLVEQNFPAFSCPLCRTYSNLDAEVQVDVDEVL